MTSCMCGARVLMGCSCQRLPSSCSESLLLFAGDEHPAPHHHLELVPAQLRAPLLDPHDEVTVVLERRHVQSLVAAALQTVSHAPASRRDLVEELVEATDRLRVAADGDPADVRPLRLVGRDS